jgi:hypothetical protein
MPSVFTFRYLGAFFIFLGVVSVLIAMLVTPRNQSPARLWRMSLTLMGLGLTSFGSFFVLDSAALTTDGPPPLRHRSAGFSLSSASLFTVAARL